MELLLDNKQLNLSNTPSNLEGVIQDVMDNFINDGRIVWSIKLNGERYSEIMPHDAKKIRFNDIRILEIDTINKKEIVLDFLKNSDEFIKILSASALRISGFFRIGDQKKSNEHYSVFLESYQHFFQMIQESINMLLPNFQEVFLTGGSVEVKIEALEKLFNQMIVCQENEDWIMLADLLEHELAPVLIEWNKLLPVLGKML